jgi:hypothetical protein
MALIRISLNNGKTAILFPEQYFRIFQALLNTAKRECEVARIVENNPEELIDADGKVWAATEFFSVIIAQKIGERKRSKRR